MSATLAAWLDRIGVEHPRGVKRGLDRVRAVADRLGVVPPARTTIVVAGTNGKGSTTAFAEHLLLAARQSVGSTTSPHLHRFNERVRVDGREVHDGAIVRAFEEVEACGDGIELSYFEYAILAALVLIRRARVDYAVLEVGLGGRLDAVNVVDADVAVVTNIGLDHSEFLGDTRELIGAEKAGIVRGGAPLVCGEPDPPASVLARACELAAPVVRAGRDFGHVGRAIWLHGPDGGRHVFELPTSAVDAVNAATAAQAVCLAGCVLDARTVAVAARTVRNPGRLEVVQRDGFTWVLDVAHNPDGAAFLADRLRCCFEGRPIRAIVGCLEDKDIAGIVTPLRPLVAELAYADTGSARGRPGLELRSAMKDPCAFAGSLEGAVDHVLSRTGHGDVIVVFGSFYIVEHIRLRLGLAPGAHDEPTRIPGFGGVGR